MFLLVLWRLIEAVFGATRRRTTATAGRPGRSPACKAVIYAAVGISALNVATHAGKSGGRLDVDQDGDGLAGRPVDHRGRRSRRDRLRRQPRAARASPRSYAKHLDAEGKSGQTGKAYLLFGKVGYIGKGIAIAIVGGLILYGGITHDASKSGNLDQALHKVLTYPFGRGPAGRDRRRHHLLRAVLLRPGAAPQPGMSDAPTDAGGRVRRRRARARTGRRARRHQARPRRARRHRGRGPAGRRRVPLLRLRAVEDDDRRRARDRRRPQGARSSAAPPTSSPTGQPWPSGSVTRPPTTGTTRSPSSGSRTAAPASCAAGACSSGPAGSASAARRTPPARASCSTPAPSPPRRRSTACRGRRTGPTATPSP